MIENAQNPAALKLLLVEDDEVDAKALRRTFAKLDLRYPVHLARDGIEALSRLRGSDGAPPLPPPFLILLDLNMPRMNGIEFLRELRGDPKLKSCVVFVLTTSAAREDKQRAYAHNVAGYIVKSDLKNGYGEAMKLLDHYARVVSLPE